MHTLLRELIGILWDATDPQSYILNDDSNAAVLRHYGIRDSEIDSSGWTGASFVNSVMLVSSMWTGAGEAVEVATACYNGQEVAPSHASLSFGIFWRSIALSATIAGAARFSGTWDQHQYGPDGWEPTSYDVSVWKPRLRQGKELHELGVRPRVAGRVAALGRGEEYLALIRSGMSPDYLELIDEDFHE
jgi:hypothetical protein